MIDNNIFNVTLDKPVIFAVVGPSGSGKTTVVEHVSNILNIPVLSSYTTRPMRDGEKQGREHTFVGEKDMPKRNEMIAYTYFGGYHYWATRQQVDNTEAILYVIDEIGLSELIGRFEKIFYIVPIYIFCDKVFTDDTKRIKRDNERMCLSRYSYKEIIANNGTLDEFKHKFFGMIVHMVNSPVTEIADWCREKAGLISLSEIYSNTKKYANTPSK